MYIKIFSQEEIKDSEKIEKLWEMVVKTIKKNPSVVYSLDEDEDEDEYEDEDFDYFRKIYKDVYEEISNMKYKNGNLLSESIIENN